MSTFECPIVKVKLEKHPNADSLSLAIVKGWQCCVKTVDFENEQYGVYIPIDSVAPADHPLLGFLEGKKVKTVKLRKEISQGVLLPYSLVQKQYNLNGAQLNQDLSSILGVKKWEEPIKPSHLTGAKAQEESRPEWLNRYTDIENWNNWPNIIQEGEEVIITEKLHGTNAIFAYGDGEFYICSHNRVLRHKNRTIKVPRFKGWPLWFLPKKKLIEADKQNVWYKIAQQYDIENKLKQLINILKVDKIALYGEIIGVQDLMYGLKKGELDFYVFDAIIGTTEKEIEAGIHRPTFYFGLTHILLEQLMQTVGLKFAPVLKRGIFQKADLDLRLGKDTLSNSHVREGIVIRVDPERQHHKLGRVILKRVSEDYLMRKNPKDY